MVTAFRLEVHRKLQVQGNWNRFNLSFKFNSIKDDIPNNMRVKLSEVKLKQFKHDITQNLTQKSPPATSKLESLLGFELRFQQGFD